MYKDFKIIKGYEIFGYVHVDLEVAKAIEDEWSPKDHVAEKWFAFEGDFLVSTGFTSNEAVESNNTLNGLLADLLENEFDL